MNRCKYLSCIIIFSSICIFVAAIRLLSSYMHIVWPEHLFVFARDVAEYAKSNQRLPSNLVDFCMWKTNENGVCVWDVSKTAHFVRFENMSPEDVVTGKTYFIAIIDPSLQKYESAVNRFFLGQLPIGWFTQSSSRGQIGTNAVEQR